MVDVTGKTSTRRVAVAESFVRLAPGTVEAIRRSELKKGDALAVARIAGLAAVKRAPDLVLLCHPLLVTHAAVDVALEDAGVRVTARVETTGPTGVEMEALTAATAAALNLYDMVKGIERGATIESTRLLEKAGGRSGPWRRDAAEELGRAHRAEGEDPARIGAPDAED